MKMKSQKKVINLSPEESAYRQGYRVGYHYHPETNVSFYREKLYGELRRQFDQGLRDGQNGLYGYIEDMEETRNEILR